MENNISHKSPFYLFVLVFALNIIAIIFSASLNLIILGIFSLIIIISYGLVSLNRPKSTVDKSYQLQFKSKRKNKGIGLLIIVLLLLLIAFSITKTIQYADTPVVWSNKRTAISIVIILMTIIIAVFLLIYIRKEDNQASSKALIPIVILTRTYILSAIIISFLLLILVVTKFKWLNFLTSAIISLYLLYTTIEIIRAYYYSHKGKPAMDKIKKIDKIISNIIQSPIKYSIDTTNTFTRINYYEITLRLPDNVTLGEAEYLSELIIQEINNSLPHTEICIKIEPS
ncbi:MAG: cation transporter [Hyphomicrobiales bacterium]